MGDFFSEHFGDIIVGGILLVIVALIVVKMIKDKKAGRSSCSGCASSSICHINAEELKKEITK